MLVSFPISANARSNPELSNRLAQPSPAYVPQLTQKVSHPAWIALHPPGRVLLSLLWAKAFSIVRLNIYEPPFTLVNDILHSQILPLNAIRVASQSLRRSFRSPR